MSVTEIICQYPRELVMGASALIGALIAAGISINQKRKDKDFKFDWRKLTDTIWQSTALGVLTAQGIECGAYGVLLACIGGIGIDRITNKLSIKETQLFNVVQLVSGWIEKKK